jgi:hypothetical protein
MVLKRNFKGVWIPKFIWENTELTMMEKVFLVEIDSLDNEKGCFASNNYFAGFFNVTPQRCSQIINSLIKKEYLQVRYEYKGKEVTKRVLNIIYTYKEKFKSGIKKSLKGYKENVKDNNTYNNTVINNIYTRWNEYNIIKHKILTSKMENKIKSILKDYTDKDVYKSIENYNTVLNDGNSFFNYKWTLVDFLQRGFEKFLDDASLTNYCNDNKKGSQGQKKEKWSY